MSAPWPPPGAPAPGRGSDGPWSQRPGWVNPARFVGRVAIVTGAGGGVGAATAQRLAAEGAAVVVADIRGDAADAVAEGIAAAGGTAVGVVADVSDEGDVVAMVAAAVERYGRLDVLHNNAAALGADVHLRDGDLVELDVGVWDQTMAVNSRGVMLGCKHAVPAMRASGGGAIVSTSSVSALVGDDVRAAYGASKAAVIALTRYVASMYGRHGIRCNAVAPGLIMSDTARAALSPEMLAELAAERVLAWVADPADIAGTVAWLASDEARCITGQTLVVDSGTTAHRPRHAMRGLAATHEEDDDGR
jgi:NAD(P)-dependent dehydrogenase (short-subunit alcohol dehydrogenase family)